MLKTRKYRALIDAAAMLAGLPSWDGFPPGVWLEGLILHESVGDPRAMRYEAHQDRPGRSDSASDGDRPGVDDGVLEDDRSYGLMQVLGSNIRKLCGLAPGTPMRFEWALLPIANVSLGLRMLLGELEATDGDVARAMARYNGGPSGDDPVDGPNGREMRRQIYVRSVALACERVAADRRQ